MPAEDNALRVALILSGVGAGALLVLSIVQLWSL